MGNNGGHNTITVATTVYGDTTGANGINSIGQIGFKIVPNPSAAYVYIYMNDNSINNATGKLYDEKGGLVEDIGYMQPTIAYTLDLTKYPAGVYILHVSNGSQDVVRKLVKE
jgi:hypothetical protein